MTDYLPALKRAVENSLGSHLRQDEALSLIAELYLLRAIAEAAAIWAYAAPPGDKNAEHALVNAVDAYRSGDVS